MTVEAVQADHRPALQLPKTFAGEIGATLKLAWPLVLTQIASMAIGTTDVLMLGRLGPDALAAAALGLSLFYMPMMFGFGLSSALSPQLAQAIGADPHGLDPACRRPDTSNELRAHLRSALWAVVLAALPAMVLLMFAKPIFGLLGQDAVLSATAASYVAALLPALPFMLLIGVMRNTFSALSRPRPALVITLGWIGVNALLNWIFIFGHFGLPAMGVVGSGIATSCATLLSAGALALCVAFHPATRPLRPFQGVLRFESRRVWRFVTLGFPIGLTLFFEGAVFNAALWLVGLFGPAPLAGHQIAINVASLTFQVPLGVAFATTVRVGYAAGAKDWPAARRSGHVGMIVTFGFMAITAFVMWTWPYEIAGLYLDLGDPKAVVAAGFAAQYLAIAAIFQLADGQQVAAAFALRGLKDMSIPAWIAGVSYWIVGFPVCVALGFWTSLEGQGVWAGLALALVVAAALMSWRFEHLTRHHRRA
ncbi:Multidrug resistance protein NorM [Alphaproteobacteria bacterium SO-S41]|nr:Multidrug resistance protein NorM [Alphaproteobacteria bacterium SO-S41]